MILKNMILLSGMVLVLALTGCGRLSHPIQPDNSFYPHTYIIQDATTPPLEDDDAMKDTGRNTEVNIDKNTQLEI